MSPEERIARRYCELMGIPPDNRVAGTENAKEWAAALEMDGGNKHVAWFRGCMEEWEREQKERVREIYTK